MLLEFKKSSKVLKWIFLKLCFKNLSFSLGDFHAEKNYRLIFNSKD